MKNAISFLDHQCVDAHVVRPLMTLDLYEAITLQIERENSLVNHRLTWMLQLNGFLFTSMAILSGKAIDNRGLNVLIHLFLPLTGLAISVAGLLGVLAAQSQIAYLAEQWKLHIGVTDVWPRPFAARNGYVLGVLPCLLPPGTLALVWCGMLCCT